MHITRYIIAGLISIIIQTTWIHEITIYELRPDLIIIIVFFASLRHGALFGIALGGICGFIQDIYSPSDIGLNFLLKTTLGFSIGYLRARLAIDNTNVLVTLIFLTTLLHNLIFYLGSTAVGINDIVMFELRYGLGGAVYTTIFALIFHTALFVRQRILNG